MKVTVKVYEAGLEKLTRVFDEGVYRVGRSDFSDIVLESDTVSRSHLELRITESAVYMTNMANGGKVKLNGKATETAELADGDEVGIGKFRLVIFHGERADLQSPPEAPAEPASSGESSPENEGEGLELPANESGRENEFQLENSQGEPIQLRQKAGESNSPSPQSEPDLAEPVPVQELPMGNNPFVEQAFRVEGTAALQRAETVVEMKPVVAKLIFIEGPRAGEELFLETFEVTFGRSKKADVFLDDQRLSRIHAKISRIGMGYRLIDMNSRNGTYVNGMRVLEHPLNSYDMIEIGSTKIKFLIHDIIADNGPEGPLVDGRMSATGAIEQTKSLQLDPNEAAVLLEFQQQAGPQAINNQPVRQLYTRFPQELKSALSSRSKLIIAIITIAVIVYFLFPSAKKDSTVAPSASTQKESDTKSPANMPREYADLSPEVQRAIEGRYNLAVKLAEQERFEEALDNLRRIHEIIPYYKNSREMFDALSKKMKEKQIAEAQERAKKDEKEDLAIYLEDGKQYLKEGDFERAAESFNSAIVIDPNNPIAIKGLKAAEYKVKDIDAIPADRDPEKEKHKLVKELFEKAVAAFTAKSYQEAIDAAEKIRTIELKGETNYLNDAKQIIDRARMLQKEEFEPFLIQAKEKFAEGDYNASRDLCEEMLKRDAAYDEAKQCLINAKTQLNRLAKEAYTRGYILESMNRIEEAKQYWNRAKNYVRAGDEYFDKVNKKLDYYQ
jgi:pSer/pThr/pTyr-binding forkhead associated (FHA) protein/tetratricopeptide (TPR) repeat protein